MNLEELLNIDLINKSVLIIGKAGSGKTYLADLLSPMVIHGDDYLSCGEKLAIQAIIEDEHDLRGHFKNQTVIEGCIGYTLLLTGLKELSYLPDVIIICEISAGRQREIYLAERDPYKLQFQKRFNTKCRYILHECFKLMAKLEKDRYPNVIILQNEFDAIKK